MKKYVIDEKFFGNFVEHMGRALYDGIYDVKEDCFRSNMTEEMKKVNTSIIRYPGGNFVSGYDWEDGIGPRELRPTRLELAWNSIEPNTVGTDEFLRWAKANDFDTIMCVNLGTGTEQSAARLVEYCNHPSGTTISEMRRRNGSDDPYGIKYWCLGNEMDGPWQIMHHSASDYAKKAREAAKMMKWVDPTIKLVACGSSQCELPTYPEWDRVVLEELYPYVDYISAHRYYNFELEKNFEKFLYSYVDMDNYIQTIRSVIKYCKSLHRETKDVYISFDEWNVVNSKQWSKRSREFAPHESESVNTFLDALVMGDMLICMLKNADIIKIACQSMLINVGAPIMTNEDGSFYYQTIYYPLADVFATKPDIVYDLSIDVPTIDHPDFGKCDVINYTLTKKDDQFIMYAVNHSDSPVPIGDIFIEGQKLQVTKIKEFTSNDLYATNTKDDIQIKDSGEFISATEAVLKPYSWNVIYFN